jgi:very-short-patch-repair endonuclease
MTLPSLPYFSVLSGPPAMLAVGVLVLLTALLLLSRSRKPWLSHIQRRPILTHNEMEFYHRLKRALPACHVFPQVSFGAFLTDDGRLSGKARWSVRARFDRKIADFVICDAGFNVLALVELDDRSHNAHADRQRDALTKAGGYQTFRFQSKKKPSEAEIDALFRHAQAWAADRAA